MRNMALFGASVGIIFFSTAVIWLASLKIPDFKSFEDRKIANSTKIYDRTGEILLYDIHQNIKRTDIPFEEMGANIKNATVAIEDSEFYNHNGVRITSTLRAVLSNIFHFGIGGGGSTITQQLVKNTLLSPGKGFGRYVRKIKEWVLAVKVDGAMSKEKILEYYLNEAPYGGTVYGIKEASRNYFDKEPAELTLAEAAYLAAIPQQPTYLSPYGKHLDKLEERKNLVLARMLELGFITPEEHAGAIAQMVAFIPQRNSGIKAPHFVFFIKEYLEQKYGGDMVENGGLKVVTTLDYKLQEKAEIITREGALKNEKDWNGKNAAVVALDPKTGQILTMIGSRDYFDKAIDGNFNVATAQRQPGSSFKPFIYATAFEKGYTEKTVLFDVPTEFQTTCNPYGRALAGRSQADCYMPDNYDGKHRGPLELRDALAQSINIPAVKLLYLTGVRDSLKTAEDMGISTLTDPSRYGLTLVIGGGEVTLLDMASAYGVFATGGVRNPYTGVLSITDQGGNILEEFIPDSRQVLSKNVALTISDILKDEPARQPTFGVHSVLYMPGEDVAVKTGTTNNNRDAWTIGYNPGVVVGVWAGNNDNVPMKKGGVSLAGPIWNKVMKEALAILPSERFEKPDLYIDPQTTKPILRGLWQGNDSFLVDKISGKLATPFTPPETIEERVVTNVHTILYWVDKKDPLGPPPANPSADPQFEHWETPVLSWWQNNRSSYGVTTALDRPEGTDNVHTSNSAPSILILEPTGSVLYPRDKKINLHISTTGRYPLSQVDVFINNVYVGTTKPPFAFSFTPSELPSIGTSNELRLVGSDTLFNRTEARVTFRVEE